MLLAVVPLLVACSSGDADPSDTVAWATDEPVLPDITPPTETTDQPIATPSAVGGSVGMVDTSHILTPQELRSYRPNELGRIPILMYHGFTTNPELLDEWQVLPETFLADLEWLYAHDFHVTSMVSLINNEIEVPAGKHPVVLTFDDSSSGQLRLFRDVTGGLTPDPTTAVGILEAFFAKHPDFGRGGMFAVNPAKCFEYEGEETTCEARLLWLAGHGYEVANHTWSHANLAEANDQTLMEEVGATKIFIDQRVPGVANLSNVLVLPFGNWPSYDWQVQMLYDGFVYDGQEIVIAGVVGVNGGPAFSPSSGTWTRWNISRFNTDLQTFDYWKAKIDGGEMTLYTSDGNPGTVTVPDLIPDDIADTFDPVWAQSYGMQLIRYEDSAER